MKNLTLGTLRGATVVADSGRVPSGPETYPKIEADSADDRAVRHRSPRDDSCPSDRHRRVPLTPPASEATLRTARNINCEGERAAGCGSTTKDHRLRTRHPLQRPLPRVRPSDSANAVPR